MRRTIAIAAAIACLALQACDGNRTVRVRVAADQDVARLPGWQGLLRSRVEVVSREYERRFQIRFKPVEFVVWFAPSETDIDSLRPALRRQAPPRGNEILLGFTGRIEPAKLGSVVPFSNLLIVSERGEDSEAEKAMILAHELAHLFGARHVPDLNSLLSSAPRTFDVDAENTNTIWKLRTFDFGLGRLGPRAQTILDFYAPDGELELASLLEADGELPQAIARYEQVIEKSPGNSDARYRLGRALDTAGRSDQALRQLRQACEMEPSRADAHEAMARILIRKSELPEAEIHLLAALKARPDSGPAHLQLGAILSRELGQLDLAISHLEKAAAILPHNQAARQSLTLALSARDDLDRKIQSAEADARKAPPNGEAQFHLGLLLMKRGRLPAAAQAFERAVKLNPALGEAEYNLSVAYYSMGNMAQARQHLQASGRKGIEPRAEYIEALRRVPNPSEPR